ncbi:MAG: sensor histidine kinase [Burkholderiaceae bacterium]|nr:MAG: sensor histidine kinase [Burkholderiaceae bacterium]
MQNYSRAFRSPPTALLWSLLVILVIAAGLVGARVGEQLGLAHLQTQGLHRLELQGARLEREITRFAFLPSTLSLHADVMRALASRQPAASDLQAANLTLEQLNQRAGTLAIFILSPQGRVMASSNWRRDDSYVNEDLSFRAYFAQAMSEGQGRSFAVGTTRGEPGYYLSASLQQGDDIVGVAVVKVALDRIDEASSLPDTPSLVTDEHGVVILSGQSAWKFHSWAPLEAPLKAQLAQNKAYAGRPILPLPRHTERGLDFGAEILSMGPLPSASGAQQPPAGRFLAQKRAVAGTPWTLTLLTPVEAAQSQSRSWALMATTLTATAGLLVMLGWSRHRHNQALRAAADRLASAHADLERQVQVRTADLQTTNEALQQQVSERERAEAELRQAQSGLVQAGKLAVIGQLAASVAHELNQPLAAMRNLAGNGLRFLERDDWGQVRGNLERMIQLVDRMGVLTAQLRQFAYKSKAQPAPVTLSMASVQAWTLLQHRADAMGVRLLTHWNEPHLKAWADPQRLEQLLVNLLGNALDAMHEQPLGSAQPRVIELSGWTEGQHVVISVRDHGPGLSEAALAHLFEPFFTTKPAGRGLGLGLTISAQLAEEMGGPLQGQNHPEGGAEFRFRLPVTGRSGV